MLDLRRLGKLIGGWMMLVGAAVGSTDSRGAVHALLIGVSDYYSESHLSDLQGPPNDVALMSQVLARRFGVPAANTNILLNPSHSQIEQAFADLATKVKPNDHVYIHYSGHGSWAPAPPADASNDAERRGEDQTWVVHGSRSPSRQGKDAMDVLDKEIALWLDPIYHVTPNVVFVSDSCHSASVTRDAQEGVRAADGATAVHPLRATIRRVPQPTTGLRIGAARDFESAVELDPTINARCSGKSNCYGVFTWHWAAALESSRPGESWGDVFYRATAAVTAIPGVLQRPQMEGVAERAIFDGQFAPVSALVPITDVQSDGTVTLGAGLLSGLTVGSVLQAMQPDAASRVKIVGTTAGSAQAVVVSGKVKAGDMLREVEHHYAEKPIKLFVGASAAVDAAITQQLRVAVNESRASVLHGFEIAPRREDADLRLEVVRPAANTPATMGALIPSVNCKLEPCGAPKIWVVSPLGQLLNTKMRYAADPPGVETGLLLSNLAQFAHAREVRAVGAQGNDTPLQLMVTVLRPPAGNNASCAEGNKEGAGWQRTGPMPFANLDSRLTQLRDCLTFTLVNRDLARTWYGYVLAVDPDLRIQPAWPPPKAMEDEARIEPHTSYAVSNSFYRLSAPGRETLLFVVSQDPVPMLGLVQSGLKGSATRGANAPLARLLAASRLTRGPETVIGTWGAQSIDLDVPVARP